MALEETEIARIDCRAREVGYAIGWDLRFVVAPNPEYVGVTAAAVDRGDDSINDIFVLGPSKLSDLAAHDIELELALLQSGKRCIALDDDGDPRLEYGAPS